MSNHLSREHLQALAEVFEKFSMEDQQDYYKQAISKYQMAAAQANRIRALMAFLAGISAALAGLLAGDERVPGTGVILLIIVAIVSPAIGGAFTTLADLYQWDRLATTFEEARNSLIVADAISPDPRIRGRVNYQTRYEAFVESALAVMESESNQWGQLVFTPRQTEEFLQKAMQRAQDAQDLTPDD